MGRGVRLSPEVLQPFLLEVPPPPILPPADAAPEPPLAWSTVFGNDHPVEIEVGFGKGLFLVTAGLGRSDTNFLGLEIDRKYVMYTANRLAKRNLTNVRVSCTDARLFLRDRVRAESVQAMHVFFPDPWWKQKHRKRRLFTEEFAAQCARVLRADGILHLVTDVEDYFDEILALVARQGKLTVLPAPSPTDPAHDLDYLTNFERKYRKEGRPIYRANFGLL